MVQRTNNDLLRCIVMQIKQALYCFAAGSYLCCCVAIPHVDNA